jgi:hypothetical protein
VVRLTENCVRAFQKDKNSACMRTIITTALQRKYLQTELILWIRVVYISSVSSGFARKVMFILFSLCSSSSFVTLMVVNLAAPNFKTLIISVSAFALSYAANMFILMIGHDRYLFLVQFCCIIVCIWKVESCVQIAGRCAPWKIVNGAENFVLLVL